MKRFRVMRISFVVLGIAVAVVSVAVMLQILSSCSTLPMKSNIDFPWKSVHSNKTEEENRYHDDYMYTIENNEIVAHKDGHNTTLYDMSLDKNLEKYASSSYISTYFINGENLYFESNSKIYKAKIYSNKAVQIYSTDFIIPTSIDYNNFYILGNTLFFTCYDENIRSLRRFYAIDLVSEQCEFISFVEGIVATDTAIFYVERNVDSWILFGDPPIYNSLYSINLNKGISPITLGLAPGNDSELSEYEHKYEFVNVFPNISAEGEIVYFYSEYIDADTLTIVTSKFSYDNISEKITKNE